MVWELDAEVLTTEGCRFSVQNSASASVALADVLAATGAERYATVLQAYRRGDGQPELLVPDRVPPMAIRHVYARGEAEETIRRAARVAGWEPPRSDWLRMIASPTLVPGSSVTN